MPDAYDLIVIGGGSGGVRAARMAAGFGARVLLAERDRMGGTCVIRGCVPKKLLWYAAHFRDEFDDAAGYGWTLSEPEFSWPALIAAKDREIARLEAIYGRLLGDAGVVTVKGHAQFIDPHTVAIDGRHHRAANVLIATGGRPFVPAIPGAELGFTSNEAFHLTELPRRVVIIGGGYIAVEFAGIFHGLGSEVTLAYRGPEFLRGFDDDVRHFLHRSMERRGIRILLNARAESIEAGADGERRVALADGSFLSADAVMFATGRIANTEGLALAAAGVLLDTRGAVQVDEYSRSSVPHLYAVGDVTQRLALTPVAIREGAAVATTLFGGRAIAIDHATVPTAVFSQPPIGTAGLSEAEALRRFDEVEIYKTEFRPMKATLSAAAAQRDERTLMKLVVDPASRRVLGAHMVGTEAPEIVQALAIAVKAGLTKEDFDATVGIHPTAAEEFVTLRGGQRVRRAVPPGD
jgi:glutathione reductase (NADPH)